MTGRADPDHGDPAICKNCIHPSFAGLADYSQIFAVQRSGIETSVGIAAAGEPCLILPAAHVAEALRIVRSTVDRQAFTPLEPRGPVQKTSQARGPPEMARGSKPPRLPAPFGLTRRIMRRGSRRAPCMQGRPCSTHQQEEILHDDDQY
jgi:hypothetical protein